MKKMLTVIFSFTVMLLFSQTYHFDYYISYHNEFFDGEKILKKDYNYLVNSKNQKYTAMIIEGKKIKAAI